LSRIFAIGFVLRLVALEEVVDIGEEDLIMSSALAFLYLRLLALLAGEVFPGSVLHYRGDWSIGWAWNVEFGDRS
jgi:hypothetical protein